MESVVVRIVAGHDPADDFVSAPREKKGGGAMFKERMLLRIKEAFALDDQRWHPRGIAFVESPLAFDERVALRTRGHFTDRYIRDTHIARP